MTEALFINTGAGNKAATAIHFNDGSVVRSATAAFVGTGGGNKQFFGGSPPPPPLTASASPDTLAWISDGGTGFVSDGSSTAVGVGGTAPYTFAWELVSGLPGDLPTSPTAATTTFISNNNFTGVAFRCLVSDSDGSSAYTNDVTVNG